MQYATRWQEFKETLRARVALVLAVVAFRLIYLATKCFYEYVFGDEIKRFYLMTGIVAIGVAFYFLRRHARRTYGGVELGFALAWAWSVAKNVGELRPSLDLISVMGILYLVVSGLESWGAERTSKNRISDTPRHS